MSKSFVFFALAVIGCAGKSANEPSPADASPDEVSFDASLDVGSIDGAVPEAATPPTVTATLKAMPNNAIAAIADVVATPGASILVEYGDTIAYERVAPKQTVPASGKVSIPLLGLLQKSTAHARVRAEKDGASATTADLTIATGDLPSYLPSSFAPTKTTPGLAGFYLLSLTFRASSQPINVMIDRTGRVVWYWIPPPAFMKAQPAHVDRVRGNFLVFDLAAKAFQEVDLFGTVMRSWKDPSSRMGELDEHDFVDLGGGRALVIGWEHHEVDSRPFFPAGSATAIRRDNTLDEIDETGKLHARFSTHETIGGDEVERPVANPNDFEIAHMNSIDVADDGTMLASMRATSSVIDVDRKTGKIIWRLGGKKSDFTFVDDPLGGFSKQHDARWRPGGKEILLLDNGNAHTPKVTRACRYAIDTTTKTAKLVWSYSHAPPIFSDHAGNVRYLPSGNVFVSYAAQSIVTELNPDTKEVVWEIATESFGLYRAMYVPTLYP